MTFLVPQQPIQDINKAVLTNSLYLSQDAKFKEIASQPIDQTDLIKIEAALKKTEIVISPSMFNNADVVYSGYKWEQKGDLIKISYQSKVDITDKDIKIDGSTVTSPFLSGEFFEKPQSHNITINNLDVQIELKVRNENWPILIKGGSNMDPDSIFLLSILCRKSDMIPQFEKLVIKSAINSHLLATSTISMYFTRNEDVLSSFYWFVRLMILTEDDNLYLFLFNLLYETDTRENFILAENMMISLAKRNIPEAYYNLGLLYLKEIPDFMPNKNLAIEYFQAGVDKFSDPNCAAMLGKLYLKGIIVDEDPKKAYKYLLMSGIEKEDVKRLFMEEEKQKSVEMSNANVKSENNKEEPSFVDYLITAGIIACVAGGIFLAKRFFRRK
ncbi:tetratricopeptide repeat protein [Histomonas meleagridis]|uniref:tetratricopeptide repeat protein n=1 Tax=Histomonas meleagridis TaxID=135588 RepID=UPI00355ABACD|nr:tetratricopeptide repeat protein [Histomonas meleagridis]KAH0796169.1 tetratricopeptide repeat protein [Histomonas meleagridis]